MTSTTTISWSVRSEQPVINGARRRRAVIVRRRETVTYTRGKESTTVVRYRKVCATCGGGVWWRDHQCARLTKTGRPCTRVSSAMHEPCKDHTGPDAYRRQIALGYLRDHPEEGPEAIRATGVDFSR